MTSPNSVSRPKTPRMRCSEVSGRRSHWASAADAAAQRRGARAGEQARRLLRAARTATLPRCARLSLAGWRLPRPTPALRPNLCHESGVRPRSIDSHDRSSHSLATLGRRFAKALCHRFARKLAHRTPSLRSVDASRGRCATDSLASSAHRTPRYAWSTASRGLLCHRFARKLAHCTPLAALEPGDRRGERPAAVRVVAELVHRRRGRGKQDDVPRVGPARRPGGPPPP